MINEATTVSVSRFRSALLILAIVACGSYAFASAIIIEDDGQSPLATGIPSEAHPTNVNDIGWLRDPERAAWTHQNVSLVLPVDVISRGTGPVTPIPYSKLDISDWLLKGFDGQCASLVEVLGALKTHGSIVIQDGRIISEVYLNGFTPDKRHQMNSATKSFLGLLVGTLAAEGVLNLDEPFVEQFPELSSSGVADGTLNHALDMTLGLDWPMGWQEDKSYRLMNFMAGGFLKKPDDFAYANTLELIASAAKEMQHGKLFAYESVNTEMLGWSVSRASGRPWQHVLSDRIWSKLGAEKDAFVIVDSGGHGFATAGMSATLRDLARAGLMVQNNGYYNERQIVPAQWIRDTVLGNDGLRTAMQSDKELSSYGEHIFYNNQFRVLDSGQGELFASGGIGQKIYINQEHKLVGVFFAANFERAETVFQVSLMRQIRDRLASGDTPCDADP